MIGATVLLAVQWTQMHHELKNIESNKSENQTKPEVDKDSKSPIMMVISRFGGESSGPQAATIGKALSTHSGDNPLVILAPVNCKVGERYDPDTGKCKRVI
jgi:hypothetical protein